METKPHFLTEEQILKMMRKSIREQRAKNEAAKKFAKSFRDYLNKVRGTKKPEDQIWYAGAMFSLMVMEEMLKIPTSKEIKEQIEMFEKWEFKNEDRVIVPCCANCKHYKWPGCEVSPELKVNGHNYHQIRSCEDYEVRDSPAFAYSKK